MVDSRGLFEELKLRHVFRTAGMYLVVAWLLLQVGETTFEALGLPEGSQRLLIVLLALGFPVALVLAWIFDLTPEGIMRTSGDPAAKVAHLRTGRRIDYAIIGSLLIVVGLMSWRTVPSPRSEESLLSDKPSIAVLPFCNLSGNAEQEYFSDGVTEDLTAVLSRSAELLVVSRTSSSQYSCQAADLKQVGHELGVRYVVEGSARRAQDRVRITAQLIDVTTDVHVWSQSYERELSPANVFDIQLDIARQISNALQVQLLD
jgi:TolB-like protein